ncbi:hypothetical protein [Methylocystis bryophila]|uniref:Uncharacterized protein n=1 Tax=Methylocystis bryophila TaxID=655015 RepID=A0A1W6MQM9_9HYPH|nr:hypothetical protein [Methylocystis bryophila]ARN79887.1 hypothetical protein B1812_01020 [Methylocystis bryophila]BDV39777.1 hypothetical protein DSM21852_30300 [Methylocystis bryophila]
MAVKFLREIVVSSLATALVTVVYSHGSDLAGISAPPAAAPPPLAENDQPPEDLAQFMQRVASGHVGKSSPRSPIVEARAAAQPSTDSDPVWPRQPGSGAGRPASGGAAKPVAAKPVSPPVDATAAAPAKPASPPVDATASAAVHATSPALPNRETSPEQAEAGHSPSYTSHIVDRFKDYVWNPGASVVSGVSKGVTNGFSAVTSRITSFVKREPS